MFFFTRLVLYFFFLGVVVVSSVYADFDLINQKYLKLKQRSLDHEESIKVLLSRPKITPTKFVLPEPKVVSTELTDPLIDTQTSFISPSVIGYENTGGTEDQNSEALSPEIDFDDLVNDPIGVTENSLDVNGSASNDELLSAYDDFYAQPKLTRSVGYYFGPLFGFIFPQNGAVFNESSPKTEYKAETGTTLGLQFGRDFGKVRWDAEYNYMGFDGETDFEISAHNFISHLNFDFEIGDRADLRTGLGLGVGFMNFDGNTDDHDGVGFIYDFVLGAGYRITPLWTLNLDYRYYSSAANDSYDQLKSHMLILNANFDL
ncbi:MAG TPA: hypothetical protein DCF87_09145 [Opitutae bacterium]|nr:hypothetical protein [Opitutae bacterium]